MDPDRWDRLKVHIAALERRFKRDLHAIVAFSTPQEALSHLLQDVLSKDIHIVLEIPAQEAANDELQSDDEDMADYLPPEQRAFFRDVEARVGLLLTGYKTRSDCFIQSDKPKVAASRRKILHIFRALEDIGLGGEKGQRVFADMMHRVMSEYVYMRFSNQWHSPSRVPRDIRDWVEENFARLTVEVLHHPDPQDTSNKQASSTAEMCDPSISHRDVTKWQDMVIGRLGRLRVSQLFDVVVDYDHSKGAVEDLKTYVATPSTRARLVSSFTSTISQRLLHPGAPTVQILEFYVSLIRAFSFLDPKGVLLDRVARPIRRYIKDRDDTVKVIVLGLQAEVENPDPDAPRTSDDMWVLDYLATELLRTPQLVNNRGDDEGELDWDDMGWTPDPVDAGPDYRKSKVSDVVGSLISIFEPKDVFVKEIQKVMGERLIKKEIDSVSETRLLELLKLRFGESALQPCEVMLRDVKESKSIDRNICSDQKMHLSKEDSTDPARSSNPVPELHAKILSRLFWPELQDQSFNVPTEIVELQARYEQGFEKLKQSRKLTWLNSLGRVTVELEFDDRVITEDVQTWQACVIYAFQTPDSSQGDRDVIRTVLDLMTELEMDESLVRNALTFWVGKRVLHQVAPDTYAVLETLSSSTLDPDGAMAGEEEAATARAAADAATTASAMSGALKSADDIATSKMHVYWQFIVGMLTNGGPMPLAQMVMMLRMTVGGTTEFGEEDLRDFLGGMVREGKLEVVGGRYKIVG
ncbi:MAG: hypothetical protein M1817_002190 [Caeruleum heppii]|nr:MAG: hypothetical protein M1817_002190 [Caeruleum heppii]